MLTVAEFQQINEHPAIVTAMEIPLLLDVHRDVEGEFREPR